MHELSIANSLLEQIHLTVAAQPAPVRVTQVEIEVGTLKLVVPDSLQLAWEALRMDTEFAATTLVIHEVKARGRCRSCAEEFPLAVDNYLCPQCGTANPEIVAGNDIVLKCLVCETDD